MAPCSRPSSLSTRSSGPSTRSAGRSHSSQTCFSLPATPPSTKPRVSTHSPASPSQLPPRPLARRLDTLPADVLYRIAELLAPTLSPYDTDGAGTLRDPAAWLDPGVDLLRLASTSRALFRAVSPRIGVHFGLVMRREYVESQEWFAALSAHLERTPNYAAVASSAQLPALAFHPHALAVPLPGARIRHLHVHTLAATDGGSLLADLLLPYTPRLASFAYVHTTIVEVVGGDSWQLGRIGWNTLTALATACPDLREVYFAGACAPAVFHDDDDQVLEQVRFGDNMEALTLVVAGDELCRLIRWAPRLKRLVVWREFTKSPAADTSEWWWHEDTWRTVEEVELRGFSGNTGRPLLQAAFRKLLALRSKIGDELVPLTSLRLSEAHQLDSVLADVVPALERLPHLRSFSFLVWRSRQFNPAFITKLADHFPLLEELGIGIETEGLHWWAGNLNDFATSFARFPHLHTLTWNHTPYADLSFALPASRGFLKSVALRVVSACPTLSTIRWFGNAPHLRRQPDSNNWEWSDDGLAEEVVVAKSRKEKSRRPVKPPFQGLGAWSVDGLAVRAGRSRGKVVRDEWGEDDDEDPVHSRDVGDE